MRRLFLILAWVWISLNIVISIVGLVVGLGDSPVIGTTNLTLIQVLWDSGTIVTPPLLFMVVAVLLLAGSTMKNVWVSRLATVALLVGVAIIGFDTQGGLYTQAPHYSPTRWALVVTLGWGFVIVSALTVLFGIGSLVKQIAAKKNTN